MKYKSDFDDYRNPKQKPRTQNIASPTELIEDSYDNDYREEENRFDIFSLPQDELNDSIEAAMQYSAKYGFFNSYHFLYYFNHSGFLSTTYRNEVEMEDEDGNLQIEMHVSEQIPLEDRRVDPSHLVPGKGMKSYINILERLSEKRYDIEFDKLYEKYKGIVHKIVPKNKYDEKYARTIRLLLIAYSDLNGDDTRYKKVSDIMELHWQSSLKNENYELEHFYSNLKEFVSPEVLSKLETNFHPKENEYTNRAYVVWSYSFWERRRGEGKTEEIYKTLCAIRDDYARL